MKASIINIVRRLRGFNGNVQTWLLYAILCVLGLCQFGCAYAQLKGASINDSPSRQVESLGIEVIREGEQITPKLGLALEKGDEIKTPPGVTALIRFVGSGSEVFMMPETHITIESVYVWLGKVIITIKGKFKTKTKLVTGSHSGTVFILTVDRNDQSVISMIEGGMELQSNTGPWSVFLKSGQEASIFSGEEREIVSIPRQRYNNLVQFINKTKLSIGGTGIKVLVPKVVGLQQNDAQSVLGTYEFRIGKVTKTIEGDYAIGEVVRQQPEPGKDLKRGGSVNIWVRARAVVVPNVIGQHRNEAMRTIQEAGLSVHGDVQDKITGKYEVGAVNDQSPRAGQRVVEGTAVKITVEADSVVVPDVRGMSVEQAESHIRERRLNARTKSSGLNPDIRTPQVVGQDPEPGNRVRPGINVTLRVANPGVRVPNVIRRPEKEAMSLLREANLGVGYVSREYHDRYPAYCVTHQSPGAGQVVKPGSTVALTVSKGPEPTSRVPNLIGLREDAARKSLTGANLRVGQVKYEYLRGSQVGVVIYQSPGAGKVIRLGSPVNFTVSVPRIN